MVLKRQEDINKLMDIYFLRNPKLAGYALEVIETHIVTI